MNQDALDEIVNEIIDEMPFGITEEEVEESEIIEEIVETTEGEENECAN